MIVKVRNELPLEDVRWGWLSTEIIGPRNGRILIQISGHSGMSVWCEALLTVPESSFDSKKKTLLPGVYEIQEAEDKRGRRLVKLFRVDDSHETNLIMFAVDGFVVPEVSDEGVIPIIETEGYSRTGRHGDRFSVVAAPIGTVVAVEPYEAGPDPDYYEITENGARYLGSSDAVLHPDEW